MKQTFSSLNQRLMAAVLTAGLSIIITACGVEVGNPTEPTPAQPANQIDHTTVMQLAANQHDEALAALAQRYDDSTTSFLSLLSQGASVADMIKDPNKDQDKRKCDASADGKAVVSNELNVSNNRKGGKQNAQYDLSETSTRKFTATVANANKAPVDCGGHGAKIQWPGASDITVSSESFRSLSRTISSSAGAVVGQTALTANGTLTTTIHSPQIGTSSINFDKTLSLSSDQTFLDLKAASPAVSNKVETLAGSELVIRQALDRLTGTFSATTIVSGTTSARIEKAYKVQLRYDMLELGLADNCIPVRGSIAGEVYLSNTSRIPHSTFTLVFSADGASIQFEDGTESVIEFAACSL